MISATQLVSTLLCCLSGQRLIAIASSAMAKQSWLKFDWINRPTWLSFLPPQLWFVAVRYSSRISLMIYGAAWIQPLLLRAWITAHFWSWAGGCALDISQHIQLAFVGRFGSVRWLCCYPSAVVVMLERDVAIGLYANRWRYLTLFIQIHGTHCVGKCITPPLKKCFHHYSGITVNVIHPIDQGRTRYLTCVRCFSLCDVKEYK